MNRICVRSYVGALGVACSSCKAQPREYCTRVDEFGVVHTRKVPCVARVHPSAIDLADDEPSPVDFSEPRRRPDEPGEVRR